MAEIISSDDVIAKIKGAGSLLDVISGFTQLTKQSRLSRQQWFYQAVVAMSSQVKEVTRISSGHNQTWVIHGTLLSLVGAGSPLPDYYLETCLHEAEELGWLSAFLTFFHSQLVRRWYDIVSHYQPVRVLQYNYQDRLSQLLGSFTRVKVLTRGDEAASEQLYPFLSYLTGRAIGSAQISQILKQTFSLLSVTIIPFLPYRDQLPQESLWQLGKRGTGHLAENSLLGVQVTGYQTKLRIQLVAQQIETLFPVYPLFQQVHWLLLKLLPKTYRVEYKLCGQLVPDCVLRCQDALRLGWSTRLPSSLQQDQNVAFLHLPPTPNRPGP